MTDKSKSDNSGKPLKFENEYATSKNTACPHCQKKTDACLGDVQSHAGAINICAYCAGVSAFNEDLSLRHLTVAEMNDPVLHRQIGPIVKKLKSLLLKEAAKKEGVKVVEVEFDWMKFWSK